MHAGMRGSRRRRWKGQLAVFPCLSLNFSALTLSQQFLLQGAQLAEIGPGPMGTPTTTQETH